MFDEPIILPKPMVLLSKQFHNDVNECTAFQATFGHRIFSCVRWVETSQVENWRSRGTAGKDRHDCHIV